jgi:hypothetical protein
VGDQESGNGLFETLAEHWNGHTWTAVPTPDPGSSGNHLYAVDAVSPDDVWAVGQQLGSQAPDNGLVEHWNGRSWSVVPMPAATASVLLDGVTVTSDVPSRGGLGGSSPLADTVWVDGEADSPSAGGRPLIESYSGGIWQTASLPASAGSIWTNLYGITVAGGTIWAAGTYVDPKTDNNNTLILSSTGGGAWTVDPGPDPGSGSNILGGLTTIDGHLWATGVYDDGGSEIPFIEHR